MNLKSLDCPHPHPLPEGEGIFAALGRCERIRLSSTSSRSGEAGATSKASRAARSCSLSPRERVRVRASVPSLLTFVFFVTSLSALAHEVRPSISGTASNRSRNLRRFVEGTRARRQHATWHLRGVSIRHHECHYTTKLICQRRLDRTLEYKTTRRINRRQNQY
jgi:hypothetical protein